MKLSLAFTALAAAADSQAPVISLNLASGSDGQHPNSANYTIDAPIGQNPNQKMATRRNHDSYGKTVHSFNRAGYDHSAAGLAKPENSTAGTQNSFADECEVMNFDGSGAAGDKTPVTRNCTLPVASAYDHHDGDISESIYTAYTLFVGSAPQKNPNNTNTDVTATDISKHMFRQRGEWVITYDVKDTSGNMAEQVQFALIMIDEVVPEFTNSPYKMTDGKTGYRTISNKQSGDESASADVTIELCDLTTDGDTFDTAWSFSWIKGNTVLEAKDNYDTEGDLAKQTSPALNLLDQDNSQLNVAVTCDSGTATPCTGLDSVTATSAYQITKSDYRPTLVGGTTHTNCAGDLTDGTCDAGAYTSDTGARTTDQVMDYTITTADFADIFGDDNQNNVYTETGTITITDSIIPTIVIPGCTDNDEENCARTGTDKWECGYLPAKTSFRNTAASHYEDCYDDYTKVYRPVRIGISCQYSTGAGTYVTHTDEQIDGWNGFNGPVMDEYAYTSAAQQCFGSSESDGHGVGNGHDPTTNTWNESTTEQSWNHHSRHQTLTLKYSVQDRFNRPAINRTATIQLEDSIAPTLFITKAEVSASGSSPNTSPNGIEFCRNATAATDVTAALAASSTGTMDYTQAHCVFAHRSGTGTHDSADWESNNGTGTNNVTGYYASYVHVDGDTNDADNSKVYHVNGLQEQADNNVYADETVIQHSAGYAADYAFVQELMQEHIGYACYDACSMTTTNVAWVEETCAAKVDGADSEEFNMLKPGTYYLKYDCHDDVGHHTTACRTFINVDKTRPVITVLQYANKNDGTWHVEASRDNNYVDAGATCSDMVDGNISQDVEVSGDVVNMAAVGTYKINYNCEDSAGQTAITATRTVVVSDSTCPTCTIPGELTTITVEASFPYTEEVSTCTDTLDGAMPDAHVYNTVDVEKTGTYVLTYSVTDKNGNGDGRTCKSAACTACTEAGTCTADDCIGGNTDHFTKTVIVEDTMVPIITVKYRGQALVGNHDDSNWNRHALMAERSNSVNGWVIGAVASAVSGLALLGYAATRKTVSTSVPV
jgi:hypothetical protein